MLKYYTRERIVTKEELRLYVQREITSLAALKHPNNERLQLIYQLGFITAQLTEAIYADSHVGSRFRERVNTARTSR